jgi:hypothetical protein
LPVKTFRLKAATDSPQTHDLCCNHSSDLLPRPAKIVLVIKEQDTLAQTILQRNGFLRASAMHDIRGSYLPTDCCDQFERFERFEQANPESKLTQKAS